VPGLDNAEGTVAQRAERASRTLGRLLDMATETRKAALARWRNAGLEGYPDVAVLEDAEAQAAAAAEELKAMKERRKALVEGLKRWQADEQRRSLQSEIDKIMVERGASDSENCLRRFDADIAHAETRMEAW
jgi:hypothetical protein